MREPCGEIGSVKGSLGRGGSWYLPYGTRYLVARGVVVCAHWHLGPPRHSGLLPHGMTGTRCTTTTLVLYRSACASEFIA